MSGYSEEEMYNTIKGAIVQWEEMVSRVESGDIESLNISREQILESKVSQMVWPSTWYLKGSIISTLSCVVTPGSKLQTMLSKSVNSQECDSRVIIIKDGCLPVNKGLKSGDPGKKATKYVFSDKDCIVSLTHSYDQQGVIYKI